jgi:hypothetical protein
VNEISPGLAEYLATAIPKVSRGLHRNYKSLEADDIAQEMWVGALKRLKYLEANFAAGDLKLVDVEIRRAGWRACKEDERIRRAEKAAKEGYHPDDEQFYTAGLLQVLIPSFLDGGVTAEPPRGRSQRRSGLLSESGDYLAMMTDLSAAMDRLKPHQRRTLEVYYAAPQGDDPDSRFTRNQIAASMGLTLEALMMRVNRAVRALQRELGGDNPWRRRGMAYDTETYVNRTDRTGVNSESGVSGRPSGYRQLALKSANQ